jgi:glycosyltransferase involved in cell wall biosynthesis
LEAMAAGRSVVATDVGGVREAMTSAGGGIVAVGDPDGLALSMLARLSHTGLAAAEGAANQARAAAHHDHQRTAQVVRNLYTYAIANSARCRRARRPASVLVQGETP